MPGGLNYRLLNLSDFCCRKKGAKWNAAPADKPLRASSFAAPIGNETRQSAGLIATAARKSAKDGRCASTP